MIRNKSVVMQSFTHFGNILPLYARGLCHCVKRRVEMVCLSGIVKQEGGCLAAQVDVTGTIFNHVPVTFGALLTVEDFGRLPEKCLLQ